MSYSIERGKRLYNSRKYSLALQELKALNADLEENPEAAYYIGLCHTQLEEWEEALFYLEQVVQSEFSFLHDYQCRMVLGYIYATTGRYKLAEYEYKKMMETGLESPQVYASLGYVAYSQRQVKESVEFLKKALDLNPDYATAQNTLGYIYAEEDINVTEAIALCKKALSQNQTNPAYLDSLGWAYYKAGRLEESRACLRKALDMMPGNKEISKHMKALIGK